MNWRNSKTAHGDDFIPCRNTGLPGPDDNCTSQDHYYDFPDCTRFPDFCGAGTGWFDWLKGQGLRTYFNDHPFPTNNGTAMQTSPDEVAFRHEGLTKWLANGLTYLLRHSFLLILSPFRFTDLFGGAGTGGLTRTGPSASRLRMFTTAAVATERTGKG